MSKCPNCKTELIPDAPDYKNTLYCLKCGYVLCPFCGGEAKRLMYSNNFEYDCFKCGRW